MIGQHNLIKQITELLEEDKFPQFAIFIGARGSGKKELVRTLFNGYYANNNSVDAIREVTNAAYNEVNNGIFIFTDVDTMSTSAKGALLKVVEECPNNNKFIMTAENKDNIPETILSRAQIFHMDIYTPTEIADYYDSLDIDQTQKERELLMTICQTPGEVDECLRVGVKEFYEYVVSVFNNIAQVSGANSFKIADKLALKADSDGYDLKLFWQIFIHLCLDYGLKRDDIEGIKKSLEAISVTRLAIKKLRVTGINKQMLVDTWILGIRKLWI